MKSNYNDPIFTERRNKLADFEEQIKNNPEDLVLKLKYARYLSKSNRRQERYKLLEIVDDLINQDKDYNIKMKGLLIKAECYTNKKDYLTAEEIYKNIINNEFIYYADNACFNLAKLKEKTYEFQQAKLLYKHCINSSNDNIAVMSYNALINIYIEDNDLEHANFYIDELLKNNNVIYNYSEICFLKAQILRKQNKIDESFVLIDAIKKDKTYKHKEKLLLEEAKLFVAIGEYEKAENNYDYVINNGFDRDKIDASYDALCMEESLGNYEKAIMYREKLFKVKGNIKAKYGSL